MTVEINNSRTFWISFTDTTTDTQVAGAIWHNAKRCYVCRIKTKNGIEEAIYPCGTKEWIMLAGIKKRLKAIYGLVTYVDKTDKWPHSQKEYDYIFNQ